MIPSMEKEFVDNHKWMDKQEFMDIMVVAQTTPGIFAIDMASHIGYKLRGVWGGIVGAIGIALPSIIAILVIYRDEIKHGLTTVSINRTHKYKNGSHISSDNIDMIMDAAYALAEMKRGALIVLPRNMELQKVIDSGTKIDANLSSNMILTIFDHDTPFHDGAIVIRGSKIEAAACYLTLSEQTNIRKTFGTRHRAALGLSEVSDALIIVVSEETQKVSVCFNGEIMYDLTREQCVRAIKQYMMFSNEDMPSFTISDSDADPWGPK